MSTETEMPGWLKKLFILFTANYRERWTDYTRDELLLKATIYMWTQGLKGFSPELILQSGMEFIKNSNHPPTLQQFLETVNTMSKNQRMEKTTQKVLECDYQPSAPSPLLAEYMATHPPQADDEFKQIFDNYTGEERGKRMLALIKRNLAAKMRR